MVLHHCEQGTGDIADHIFGIFGILHVPGSPDNPLSTSATWTNAVCRVSAWPWFLRLDLGNWGKSEPHWTCWPHRHPSLLGRQCSGSASPGWCWQDLAEDLTAIETRRGGCRFPDLASRLGLAGLPSFSAGASQ